MKHPTCPPEYRVEHEASQLVKVHLAYSQGGRIIKYIRIKRGKDSVANIDERGSVWEMWNGGAYKKIDFPTLDDALRYAETKMALGILGEKE